MKSWLLRPLLDLKELLKRQDSVSALIGNIRSLDMLRNKMRDIHDLERLVSRVMAEVSNPREILALRDSLRVVPAIQKMIHPYNSERISEIQCELDPMEDVVTLIETAISDSPPVSVNEPGIIRSGYSYELDELRDIRASGRKFITSLESKERERTGIQSLKIKFNNVFGYFIEVTKANLSLVPDHYLRKQTLVNCERFVTGELQEYEEKILRAEERIHSLENEIFTQLRKYVGIHGRRIQKTARLLGEDLYPTRPAPGCGIAESAFYSQ
ncbi:MAG: hypothetical protein P8Z37_11265 [Acidobacteriota bacterium]